MHCATDLITISRLTSRSNSGLLTYYVLYVIEKKKFLSKISLELNGQEISEANFLVLICILKNQR